MVGVIVQQKEELLLNNLLTNYNLKELLKVLFQQLPKKEYSLNKIIHLFGEAKQEQLVPLSIFSQKLYPAEALCKYLKENERLSYQQIGKILGRNQKSVWATYQRATKKSKLKFYLNNNNNSDKRKEDQYFLPISLFSDYNYSFLENVILHLRSAYLLNNKQIAKLLHKTPNSIAVLAKRAREKSKQKEKRNIERR